MKSLLLLVSLTSLFFAEKTFSQVEKPTDYLRNNQLYLSYNNRNVKFDDIKRSTIIKLFGQPIRIKKERGETTDAQFVRTYIYAGGEIVLEDNDLTDININKSNWAFTFKMDKSFSKLFTLNGNTDELKKLFPIETVK